MQTVAQALAHARGLALERLDAQLIVAARLAQSRSWVIAHYDAMLEPTQAAAIQAWFTRRAAGEPLAYLLGEKEFHGLLLQVDANVLVPRPDTELLVDWAIELLAGVLAPVAQPCVVDLGTGSGAIALAVKHAHPAAAMTATDLSPAALGVARANAQRLGLDLTLRAGAWWAALDAGQRFHLVLSNPPYIAGADPHLAALIHEPTLALTPGGDGLGALREIAAGAGAHVEAGGWLLLEHGFNQADAVRLMLQEHGWRHIETRRDLGGRPRCTGACR